jgi:hypothetical protein
MAWRDLNKVLFCAAGKNETHLIRHALVDGKAIVFDKHGQATTSNKPYHDVSYKGYIKDWKHPQINGWTASHAAAQHGHTDSLKLLLDYGFSKNAVDDNGMTVYDIAAMFNHKGMCAWLRQYKNPTERQRIAEEERKKREKELRAERAAMEEVELQTELAGERRGLKLHDMVKVWWYDFNEAYEGELIGYRAEKILCKVGSSPRDPVSNERDESTGFVKLNVPHGRVFCKTGAYVLYDGVDKKLHPLQLFYRAMEHAKMDWEDRNMTEIRRVETEKRLKAETKAKKKADKAARKRQKAEFKAEQKRLDEEAKAAMEAEFDAGKLRKMKKAYDKEKKEKKKAHLLKKRKDMTGY